MGNKKISYDIKIYETNSDNSCRFTLGTIGAKPLFIIGLNPSTADDKKPDLTITKVIGFAEQNEYDSFVMLNLYPQRTPYPNDLPETLNEKLYNENLAHILKVLGKYSAVSILAAWGETISVRPYFKTCLSDIYAKAKDLKANWLQIGLTKSGHPRHPSRAPYGKLENFDVEAYLQTI